jgi:ribonuclease P protein component
MNKEIATPVFNLCYQASKTGIKIGFAIRKKTCPKATERNRIKRKIREFIRNNFTSGDFFISLKKASIDEIMKELKNVTEKHSDFFC